MRRLILNLLCFLCVGWSFSKAEEDKDLRATIKSLTVTSDIKFRYATTRVSAEYINTYNSPVTADFHVTLPARAYISNFSMTLDGNTTYGVVKKKEEAKAIYDKAVAQGQSTGYVEVKHRFTNVYDMSVNVEPGKNVVFNLTYQELLQRSLGKYRHVIHLINKEIINDFVVEVFISEPQDIVDIQIPKIKSDELESPKEDTEELEEATIEYIDDKTVYIRYSPSAEEQKKFGDDGVEGLFKVYYDVDRKDNPNMVYAVDGYFVHFFAPDSLPPLPKNIVFMLDVSGSMQGQKMDQMKEAMISILNSLKPDVDSFLIGVFSRSVRWMNYGRFQPATKENTEKAINHIKKLHADGSTNMNAALLECIEKLNDMEYDTSTKNVVFFLTDGQPSTGVTNTGKIQRNVKAANTKGISFFMLGFGRDADKQFLSEIATDNGGFSRKIYEAADSKLQIEGLYNEIANILLKDIEITYLDNEIDSETLTPTNFSTYFNGSEFCMTGLLKYDNQDKVTVQMKMTDVHGEQTVEYKLDLINLTTTANSPNLTNLNSLSEITRNTWVYLTLKKLFKEERTENITEEITSLALQYGFVTPLTSMVVTKSNLVGRVQEEDDDRRDTSFSRGGYHGRQGSPSASMIGVPGKSHRRGMFDVPRMSHNYNYPVRKQPPQYMPMPHTTTPHFMRWRTPSTTTRHPMTWRMTTLPPRPPTTTSPFQNQTETLEINFFPGILLRPFGCNETLCIGDHRSCRTHTRVLLLADNQAYIYIYGYLVKSNGPSCMKALRKVVIKKKRKVLAQITPEMMKKNQKTISLANKSDVVLNVKKYLKLRFYIKTVDNQKVLSVHFTILQPLPNPNGMLSKYMTDATCSRRGRFLDFLPGLFEKVTYTTPSSDKDQCFMFTK